MASTKLKAWISAARLRTLPLSISGILVGSAFAYYNVFAIENNSEKLLNSIELNFSYSIADNVSLFMFNYISIVILALITTLGFQILSNFANDYGDGVKGTDNEDRIGPMRAIQSGIISPQEMKRGMVITAILTLISAILLIYVSLGIDRLLVSLFFLALGIAAIWAAIKYTVGDNAYGYRGLGDVFVFIFFGPVSVMGIYYLITTIVNWEMIFPSMTIGLLSVAVLNLNNMRDVQSDKKAGKNTIVVKLGLSKAKMLHYGFVIVAFICALRLTGRIYFTQYIANDIGESWMLENENINLIAFLPLLAFIPLLIHLIKVKKTTSPALLDPELKKVALSTFLFAVLCCVSVWIISSF
ncbi:1,4-dihydroxy-2-naphthoate prenyltransferase [Nonlabens dokdonensis]|uniref:1,4-dihydroxy-2-naphthoate octaprenyltransferase n=2 Tax=Nonlabens dokdonensis TaxID=328515 RepID=L7WI05_NONDD|nr:1,4-dihydroxy-2-naphthoate octaprenyltransferase [Nonlabens dokdonensis]AGC78638.1 1,4-dihydroxy-2-naphthoate octaprenyltransferase [Nonlabens dokdonensis DSW-6]PZX39234.1 1,4-dihydroxy-2-naphthoate prenyltransferase [Nonlabens dokdonensis]